MKGKIQSKRIQAFESYFFSSSSPSSSCLYSITQTHIVHFLYLHPVNSGGGRRQSLNEPGSSLTVEMNYTECACKMGAKTTAESKKKKILIKTSTHTLSLPVQVLTVPNALFKTQNFALRLKHYKDTLFLISYAHRGPISRHV